eukprot:scaffold763_cov402-Prasinococcus_capsulatus_cf.AAC.16
MRVVLVVIGKCGGSTCGAQVKHNVPMDCDTSSRWVGRPPFCACRLGLDTLCALTFTLSTAANRYYCGLQLLVGSPSICAGRAAAGILYLVMYVFQNNLYSAATARALIESCLQLSDLRVLPRGINRTPFKYVSEQTPAATTAFRGTLPERRQTIPERTLPALNVHAPPRLLAQVLLHGTNICGRAPTPLGMRGTFQAKSS